MTLKRYRVTDKAADLPGVYTTKKLGHTQALTPEGFLLCTGVPIKRLGEMLYGPCNASAPKSTLEIVRGGVAESRPLWYACTLIKTAYSNAQDDVVVVDNGGRSALMKDMRVLLNGVVVSNGAYIGPMKGVSRENGGMSSSTASVKPT